VQRGSVHELCVSGLAHAGLLRYSHALKRILKHYGENDCGPQNHSRTFRPPFQTAGRQVDQLCGLRFSVGNDPRVLIEFGGLHGSKLSIALVVVDDSFGMARDQRQRTADHFLKALRQAGLRWRHIFRPISPEGIPTPNQLDRLWGAVNPPVDSAATFLAIFPGTESSTSGARRWTMHVLHGRVRKGCSDGVRGKPLEAVDDSNQDVLQPTVLSSVHSRRAKIWRPSLSGDPKTENLAHAIFAGRQGHVDGFVLTMRLSASRILNP